MKIADGSDLPQPDSTNSTVQSLEREKMNGNLSRARRLGAILAEDVSAIEGKSTVTDSAFLTQRRLLLAFAVEVGLESLFADTILAQTARNVFSDTLRAIAPTFFEDLENSAAFSFYYLCVRDGRDVEKRVGDAFAALCGKKEDMALSQMGQELYRHFIAQVEHVAQILEFV